MTNDELKDIWTRQSGATAIVTPEKVWRLAKASERFEHTIFWRNAREWIATVVLEGLLLWSILSRPTVPWLLVGAAVLVCWPMTYATLLRRKRPDPDLSRRVSEHLRDSIASVQQQIALLRSVLWWYLTPCVLAILLIFVDLRQWERGFIHNVVAFGVGIFLYVGIWLLNQRAVRKDLEPRLRRLQEALAELEGGAVSSPRLSG